MSDLVLEPYAVQQRWQMPAPLSGRDWPALLAAYLASLARACSEAGPCVIGHIKALALFPDGGYLRVSVVSSTHPPTTDGQAPDGVAELAVTLNVLVYGLARDVLQKLSSDIAADLAATHAGRVTVKDAASVGQPLFPNVGEHTHHSHPN